MHMRIKLRYPPLTKPLSMRPCVPACDYQALGGVTVIPLGPRLSHRHGKAKGLPGTTGRPVLEAEQFAELCSVHISPTAG